MKHLKLYEEYNSIYPPFYTDKDQILDWVQKGLSADVEARGNNDISINDDGSVNIELYDYAESVAKDSASVDASNEVDFASQEEDVDYESLYQDYLDYERSSDYYNELSTFKITEDMLVDGFLPVQIGNFKSNLYIEDIRLYSLRGFPKTIDTKDDYESFDIMISYNPITSLNYYPVSNESKCWLNGTLLLEKPANNSILIWGSSYRHTPLEHTDKNVYEEFYRLLAANEKWDPVKVMQVLQHESPKHYQALIKQVPDVLSWVERVKKSEVNKDIMDL